jgi:hypothetical protein
LRHAEFDIGVALLGVGVNDVGIADIDDAAVGQVGGVVLMVVGAGVAEGEQCGRLADCARAKTGAGAPLRAAVERRAEDLDIGGNRILVELDRVFPETANVDERQVEPAGIIAMHHLRRWHRATQTSW